MLPILLPQSKWYKQDRKVQVGDIVHVKDINPVRGNWKIAEITDIKQSHDGVPRNVEIRYKVPGKIHNSYRGVKSSTEIRDVKTLVLILSKEERK